MTQYDTTQSNHLLDAWEHAIWQGPSGTGIRGLGEGIIVESHDDQGHVHRTCFKCKRDLWYREAIASNGKMKVERFAAIWDDTLFELLCCNCFNVETRKLISRAWFDEANEVEGL